MVPLPGSRITWNGLEITAERATHVATRSTPFWCGGWSRTWSNPMAEMMMSDSVGQAGFRSGFVCFVGRPCRQVDTGPTPWWAARLPSPAVNRRRPGIRGMISASGRPTCGD